MTKQIYCQFKHIPSIRDGEQLATNIETFARPKLFHKNGIKNCGANGNDNIQFRLTREEANEVRNELIRILPKSDSPIWFNILSEPLDLLIPRSLQTTDNNFHEGSIFSMSCQFGSLRSYNQFYSHVSFNNSVVEVSFRPARDVPDSLNIEFDDIRLTIPFKSIQKENILVNKENTNGVYILFPLKYTPYVYRLEPVKSEDKSNKNTNMKEVRICANEEKIDFLQDLALCSDVVFHFLPSKNMAWSFLSYFLIDRPERYEINFSNFTILDWPKEANKKLPDPFNYKNASFQDRYGLQMLISLGYVFRDKWAQLTDQELKWNQWNANERYTLCCFAVEQLYKDHGYDLTKTKKDYDETRRQEEQTDNNMNENIVLIENAQRLKIATCTLTPLKVIFQPLEITTGNRALRNPQLGGPERFLLVHFRDEDNQRLRVNNRNIQQRLKNSMIRGIELFGRTFIYMGASTGQMKEMAFWYIDLPPHLKTITDAHNLLGTFTGMTNIATYIARVGQYFSSTWPIGIKLTYVKNKGNIRPNGESYYVSDIDDIKRGDYCFTDGIGKISWGLAGRVAQKMNIPLFRKEDIPSAYQIRVAGCKGMVAIDPDSTLNDYYIYVRDSMIKFVSDDWNLEICEFARPMTLSLNNQVIRLLSDLKTPDSEFIALQNRGFTHWQVPEEQQPSAIDIAVEKNASYSLSKDNLVKNRIPIPPTDGRNMFGVADETGELKYGECFIQYSSFNSTASGQRQFRVVTGTIIVTKNPCLWPGDFRRLTAVRNRKLEECMRDVIVFPIDGKRPHPNEIAGSDLDGDQYWVYWGDRLTIDRNEEPLSYKSAEKAKVPSITYEQIIDHIVHSFGAGVVLGMIANTHSAVADRHPEHSFSAPSKKLAELFALAVDSPKTGIFIDKKEIRPFQAEYCKRWPKYMRKFGEPQYISTSILEQLFCNAENQYHKLKESPPINKFPRARKAIQDASAIKIEDEKFKKWLDGGIYEETENQKKLPRKKPNKSNKVDSEMDAACSLSQQEEKLTKLSIKADQDSQSEIKKNVKKLLKEAPNRPETPNPPSTSVEPKPARSSIAKISSDIKNSCELQNSSGATANTSSLSSLASSNIDQCRTDFLMVCNTRILATSVIQFIPVTGHLYQVKQGKETSVIPDRENIIEKLTTDMTKKVDVLKKKLSYNEAQHGSLYLMVFYGHIYFVEQNPFPQKFGMLQKRIEEGDDEFIRFHHADINKLNIREISSSTTRKNRIDYEFDCRLASSSSEYITLLFDKNKTLRQVRIYRIWSKCYVRQPNLNADCLYEIRSLITHDSGSTEFNRIVDLVLRTQSTGLLNGHKPNIKISREILHSSVIPISLKIIDEDQQTYIDPSISDAFYRKVRYISIDEEQDKPKPSVTMEYHVSSIRKDNDILEKICDLALSPTEDSSSI